MAGKITKSTTDSACEFLGGFFTTLAHPTRMRIFCALQNGPRAVSSIADHAGITIANASQHLRLMRDNGAVVSEKRGQSVYYQIADPRFLYAASMIRQALVEQMQSKTRGGRGIFAKKMNADDFFVKQSRSANQPQL